MQSTTKKSKAASIFRVIYMALAAALFALSYLYELNFVVGYSLCALIFGIVQIRLIPISRKDETYQQKKCKSVGFPLLIPALGMIANGIGLLYINGLELPPILLFSSMGISAAIFIILSALIICFRKDSSLAARFLRYSDCAALSVPVSLLILLALTLSADESAMEIGCMSAILLGALSLLIAVNMILTSFCGYMSTRDSIKTVSALARSKKHIFFRTIIIKDGFLVFGKLIISLLSLSFFMFVNGLYSVGMGLGRFIAVRMHTRSKEEQLEDYRRVGGIILFSSVCYVLYSVRLFFGGKTEAFPMVVAIAIAFYTFVEFGINIREILRLRKSASLEAKALRALSFSSTLLCFVLTQTALMSFAHEGDTNFLNALSGVVFGGLAALVGLYVILSAKRILTKQ